MTIAPDVEEAFGRLTEIRPSGVHDETLESAAVRRFAEQFGADVSAIDDGQRDDFVLATGDRQFDVAQMVWIADVAPRLRAGLDALFGAAEWPEPARRYPVASVWSIIEVIITSVARLTALDATTTELIRLRGARQHNCRLCASRRSAQAIEAGAGDPEFAAVDDYADSDLPEATKVALALVDALIWTPTAIPEQVVADVREHLSDAQAVEVVLDVARNAANKIAVALGADAPEVTDGVQLFTTDVDGTLSVV
ncbi:carboxymuconolactone decarboxylase family protein [Nocardioides sp.]|uniref:carboxymuconolactone decarboxylase family protein n=1 Tax=Nocardioides sp. TaxID=35761 RepID=UPI003564F465